jgi:pimeloyl-ACP methyl ester carboxylesterase/DNA-binding winged helix-turn-helix (wHTH) protein
LRYVFEDFSLDVERRELRRGVELIAVEPLVFDLLLHLISNRHRVVTKDDLIAAVWNGRIVSESTLTSRMNAVRHAIADSGEHQRLIRTIPRKGHRFVGEVQESQEPIVESGSRPSQRPLDQSGPAEKSTAPLISFCRTTDGVSLAVATVGAGPVVLRSPQWFTHLEYEWQNPLTAPLLHRLSRNFRLAYYDSRGTGLSDRNISELSLATAERDLETVADSLGLDRFALLGMSGGAGPAIAYAARHPERVSKLVLVGGYALGRNKRRSPQTAEEAKAFYTMMRSGWGDDQSPFWRAFSTFFLPNASREQLQWWLNLQRAAFTPEIAMLVRKALDDFDVFDLLPRVTAPTIVFHCTKDNLVPFEQGRLLAASIPNAKLLPLESENHLLLSDEPAWIKFADEMEAFLADEG